VKGLRNENFGFEPLKIYFRCSEEFHFTGDSENIEFCEMQEGDETDLFWNAINERTHQRKYYSLLNGNINI
jgi:hypothetical protein